MTAPSEGRANRSISDTWLETVGRSRRFHQRCAAPTARLNPTSGYGGSLRLASCSFVFGAAEILLSG